MRFVLFVCCRLRPGEVLAVRIDSVNTNTIRIDAEVEGLSVSDKLREICCNYGPGEPEGETTTDLREQLKQAIVECLAA